MNNFLLRGILGATVCLVTGGAFAQTTVTEDNGVKHNVSLPTADTYLRMGYTKTDLGGKDVIEINTGTDGVAGFVGLLSFSLTDELHYSNYVASKANLRLVTRSLQSGDNVNVFEYGGTFDEKTLYSAVEADVTAAHNTGIITSFNAKGQKRKALSDKGLTGDYTKLENWVNNIDLTKTVNNLADSKLNIMIESADKNSQSIKIFSREVKDVTCQTNGSVFSADDLKPQLTVDYALATHTLSVTDAGAATLVLPYEAEIPENVKAYTLTYTSGDKAVATEVTDVIPANTPVLINANEGNYTFKATATLTTKNANPTSGNLYGVWNEDVVPVGSYVLQKQNGTVAFYRVATEGFKIQPNQAYLYAPKTANVRMLSIGYGGDGTTAINGVEAETTNTNTQVYTIDGKKVNGNNLTRGQIYISNGKKFILK